MKKKLLTVALAATMVFSSVFSAFAETKSEVTIGGGFSANSGDEVMQDDFDVTYTFTNTSNDTSQSWFNFILELNTVENVGENAEGVAAPVYIDMRADKYGWFANQLDTTASLVWAGDAVSGTYATEMGEGVECTVNIVRIGNTFTVTMNEGEYEFVATATCADFEGQNVAIRLTGEQCTLTNITFTVNPSPVADENPETDPAQPSTGNTEDSTTAKGETTTTNGSVDTGKTETETTAKKEESSTNGSATTTDTTVDAVVSESEAADIQKAAKVEGMKDTLVVKAVDASSADFKVAAKAIGDKVKFAVVDLTLASGKQPVAGTKVTLPLMKAIKDAKFVKVSAIKDGKMETVAIVKVADGKITFEPKHFSTYVFSEATEAEFNAANTDSSKTNTGDSTTVAMTLAIAAVAAGAVVVARAKRKENA